MGIGVDTTIHSMMVHGPNEHMLRMAYHLTNAC